MIKKFFLACGLMSLLMVAQALSLDNKLLITTTKLPKPYNILLTQPLMTPAIEQYYQRTPIIQTLYEHRNRDNNTYSRVIIMLLDSSKSRNDPWLAKKRKETIIVELAFITMNFNELPQKIIREVLTTPTPLGKLLIKHHVKTDSKERAYFTMQCDKEIASLIHCKTNQTLYGRKNTIIRADNKRWLAQVIEILP